MALRYSRASRAASSTIWAMTLLDSCAACAVQTTLAAGQGYTSVETKVNFTRPLTVESGLVRAEGRVISIGRDRKSVV